MIPALNCLYTNLLICFKFNICLIYDFLKHSFFNIDTIQFTLLISFWHIIEHINIIFIPFFWLYNGRSSGTAINVSFFILENAWIYKNGLWTIQFIIIVHWMGKHTLHDFISVDSPSEDMAGLVDTIFFFFWSCFLLICHQRTSFLSHGLPFFFFGEKCIITKFFIYIITQELWCQSFHN